MQNACLLGKGNAGEIETGIRDRTVINFIRRCVSLRVKVYSAVTVRVYYEVKIKRSLLGNVALDYISHFASVLNSVCVD